MAQAASERDSLAATGLVYKGLKQVAGGPCGALFQIDMPGPARCTHGPDPAPAGVDVRERRPLAELAAALPPRALFSASPTKSLVPCVGDGVSGTRVQAVYARQPGWPDRFEQVAPMIHAWASQVDETYARSAAETGGVRHVRFVTENCRLSILDLSLRADTTAHTFQDLRRLGRDRPDRKYLIWMDANVICGIGQSYPDSRAHQGNQNNGPSDVPGMVARIDEGCWGDYDVRGSTEAHELTHTLGAVLGGAPHATNYGHCWDTYDVMCYDDGPRTELKVVCPRAHQQLLDCGHDDYFSTAPPTGSWLRTHWNVASSGFLADETGNQPPVAPAPPPPPPPRPLPPSGDTKRPVVKAEKASIKHRKTARLRFRVSDDSGTAYVTASVFRKSARLLQFGPRPLDSGRYSVRWTAPAKAQLLRFCVQAYDGAGNQSAQSCAAVKVT